MGINGLRLNHRNRIINPHSSLPVYLTPPQVGRTWQPEAPFLQYHPKFQSPEPAFSVFGLSTKHQPCYLLQLLRKQLGQLSPWLPINPLRDILDASMQKSFRGFDFT